MLKSLKNYKTYLLIGYALLLLIHFGCKDHFYITGVIFYAFPIPIIILITVFLLILLFKNKFYKFLCIIIVFILCSFWFNNYYFYHNVKDTQPSISVLFWNIAKQKDYNLSVLTKTLKDNSIDVAMLVEAVHKGNPNNEIIKKQLKNYNIDFLKGNIIVLHKGYINNIKYMGGDFHIMDYFEIEIYKNIYKMAVVDIYADPLLHKKTPLNIVLNYAKQNNIDLIAGDFNTPYESIHFKNYKVDYESMRFYQNGYSATWPRNIPLLELDQIWLHKKLKPIALKKQYIENSDHAILIGSLEVN